MAGAGICALRTGRMAAIWARQGVITPQLWSEKPVPSNCLIFLTRAAAMVASPGFDLEVSDKRDSIKINLEQSSPPDAPDVQYERNRVTVMVHSK